MSGLDKIIEKIESDAKERCSAVLSEAQKKASEIIDAAKAEGERIKAERIETAKKKRDFELELAHSKAETELKKAALSEKIKIVNEAINEALQTLKNLPADKYFAAIKELAAKYALPKEGVMLLSKADLDRLPKNFEEQLSNILGKGKSVKVGKDPAPIDSGFILSYKDIEQNCCFESLLEENLDEIRDAVSKILFSGEDR
ncbi:MAG TPA: V-type ATP synthase subunit E family protein [Clostridia bacterium]